MRRALVSGKLAGRARPKRTNFPPGLHKDIRIFFIAGETVYASTKKATSGGGTLGRRTRRGHASALSSSSTASDRSETVFPDEHTRMHLTNGKRTVQGALLSHPHIFITSILACVIIASRASLTHASPLDDNNHRDDSIIPIYTPDGQNRRR